VAEAEAPAATPEHALRLAVARRAGWRSLEEAEEAPLPVQRPGKV
jgi:hypothetical protein